MKPPTFSGPANLKHLCESVFWEDYLCKWKSFSTWCVERPWSQQSVSLRWKRKWRNFFARALRSQHWRISETKAHRRRRERIDAYWYGSLVLSNSRCSSWPFRVSQSHFIFLLCSPSDSLTTKWKPFFTDSEIIFLYFLCLSWANQVRQFEKNI